MAHKLKRLAMRYTNKPQLMTQTAFDAALDYLQDRNEGVVNILSPFDTAPMEGSDDWGRPTYENGVGIIPIQGPLLYDVYDAEPLCGPQMTSYQRVETHFKALIDEPSVNTILLDIDSEGGEAYGCFETAQLMRRMADEAGKTIIAYVDGLAASAGYALAAAAHEIIINPYAEAGSVGVVVRLVNTNKAEQSIGIEKSYIFAGESKIPFTEEGDFREEFLEDIQEKVDDLYAQFVTHVASLRSLGEDAIRNTQAKTFSADKAVALGLVDEAMTREEFLGSYLPDIVETKGASMLTLRKNNDKETLEAMSETTNEKVTELEATVAEMATTLTEQSKLLEATLAANKALEKEKQEAELAELTSKVTEYAFIGTENAEAVASILFKMDTQESDTLLATLTKANEAVVEAEKSLEEDKNEMLTQLSVSGESTTDATDLKQRVSKITKENKENS